MKRKLLLPLLVASCSSVDAIQAPSVGDDAGNDAFVASDAVASDAAAPDTAAPDVVDLHDAPGSNDAESGADGSLEAGVGVVAYRLADPVSAVKPDYVKAIATGPEGDVAVALIQSDTITIDDVGTTLAASGSDVGVIVYDHRTGAPRARFSFGGAALRVVPHGLAFAADGDVVVVGYAASNGASSVDFGAGATPFASAEAPFVARFSPTGVPRWAHVLQGTGGTSPTNCLGTNCDRAWDVAIGASGDIAVVGGFSGTLAIPGGTLTSAGGSDLFVLVLSATGERRAAWTLGGPGTEGGFAGTTASPGGLGETSIAATSSGWMVTGTFQGDAELRGTGVVSTKRSPTNGARDVFLARYSASGALEGAPWVAQAAADVLAGLAAPGAMRLDSAGNVYLSIRANVSAQTYAGCAAAVGGTGDALVTVSLDPSLACRWTHRLGFSGGGVHRTVPDGAGAVYVAGWFSGTHAFPNRALTSRSTRSDVFLARLDAKTGAEAWGAGVIATAAVAAPDICAGLAIDGDGHPWIGGQFFTPIELAQPGQPSKVLTPVFTGAIAATSNDGFVARYAKSDGALR